jgi:hypothetical protein
LTVDLVVGLRPLFLTNKIPNNRKSQIPIPKSKTGSFVLVIGVCLVFGILEFGFSTIYLDLGFWI